MMTVMPEITYQHLETLIAYCFAQSRILAVGLHVDASDGLEPAPLETAQTLIEKITTRDIFGEEFRAAYSLLLLLLLDPVCIAVFGPASNVVSFSKRPYALLPPLAAGLTVLIGGTALFGATWGLWGAGLAYVLARVCWLAWLAGYCIVKLGINPTIFSVFAWAKQRKG